MILRSNHSFARIADCLITPAKAQTRKTGFDRGVANLGYTASDIEGRQCLDWRVGAIRRQRLTHTRKRKPVYGVGQSEAILPFCVIPYGLSRLGHDITCIPVYPGFTTNKTIVLPAVIYTSWEPLLWLMQDALYVRCGQCYGVDCRL